MKVLIALCGLVCCAHGAPIFFQKGVNLTAEWGGRGYSPVSSALVLDRLKGYGVNAIALVPYGAAMKQGTRIRYNFGMERSELVASVTALAHQRGMKVMLKPQIWVRDAGFPGDIEIPAAADRATWFAEYRQFLEHYSELAARIRADLLCVGVEFVKMSRNEAEWRRLIARARELYSGPLVYAAAQGEEFESIRFWDALDYIGLSNYYPLPDTLSTEEIMRKIEAVQRKYRRPVIFAEAGFPSMKAPHRAPWDESPRELSMTEQARCYEALLRAFYHKPWFQGVYWWKVGTDGHGGPQDGSYTPWGKPAMEVLGKWYREGGR